MRTILISRLFMIILICFSQPLWAGCESTILEGSHTALTKKDAKVGAWEDAREMCYPGDAAKLTVSCKKVQGDNGVQGKKAFQCRQEVSCNVCGADLQRKYEGME